MGQFFRSVGAHDSSLFGEADGVTVRSGQSGRADAGRLLWNPDQDAALAEAIGRARDGIPTVLFVDGAPGTGKSAFVRHVVAEADDFAVLTLFGDADDHRPYGALLDLGAVGTPPDPGLTASQAARMLRLWLTDRHDDAAVLLAVDDLADLDAESRDSLARLVEHDRTGRILIAVATRSAAGDSLAPWRRILLDDDRALRVHLTGLTEADAARVVAAEWPDADADTSRRLWRHTSGNPLLLKALLRERTLDELRDLEELPAPRDLARALTDRVDRLSTAPRALLRAVAVLGDRWSPLRVAAVVAGFPDTIGADTTEAVANLQQANLLITRTTSADREVRVASSVSRRAIVDALTPDVHRTLHESAASAVDSPIDRLHHRLLATEGYDESLARDLADLGWSLHLSRRFREAGRVQRWASIATAEPTLRERRLLDALFDTAMARDLDAVSHELDVLPVPHDESRRAVVDGLLLILQHRWSRAATVLGAVSAEARGATDRLTRYRLQVLLAWSLVVTGAGPERVRAELALAAPDVGLDARMSGYFGFATALANGIGSQAAPAHVTGGLDLEDAWQGAAAAVAGMPDVAIRHLRPFVAQVDAGTVAMGDGEFHALLGYALWLRGDWSEARRLIRAGSRARYGSTHPMVAAVLPLADLSTAGPASLQELLGGAHAAVQDAPWPPAISMAMTAELLCRQLAPDRVGRPSYGEPVEHAAAINRPGAPAPLWLLTCGARAAASGRVEDTVGYADRLEAAPEQLRWRTAGVGWLSGLAAEAAGEMESAVRHLRAARTAGMGDLAVHGVLLARDLARVEEAAGDHAAAEDTRRAAEEALATIDDTGSLAIRPRDPLAPLSDREREVVGLLSQGMSYAQIAAELFVSRSTVAFHLSNVYAKTATGSRHELVELVRRG